MQQRRRQRQRRWQRQQRVHGLSPPFNNHVNQTNKITIYSLIIEDYKDNQFLKEKI